MTSTTTTTQASADLTRAGQHAILTAAVTRAICCPFTGTVLDVRDAVYIEDPDTGVNLVMTATLWDERGPGWTAEHPDTQVIDGRTL